MPASHGLRRGLLSAAPAGAKGGTLPRTPVVVLMPKGSTRRLAFALDALQGAVATMTVHAGPRRRRHWRLGPGSTLVTDVETADQPAQFGRHPRQLRRRLPRLVRSLRRPTHRLRHLRDSPADLYSALRR